MLNLSTSRSFPEKIFLLNEDEMKINLLEAVPVLLQKEPGRVQDTSREKLGSGGY